ncbi:MAG: hypothetical protein Unbinned5081contig1000_47 [Prokaryotic dsDNA virus sp.]|nr:MAG: hypothetical protein Unbinned5081contig1000_47 [Prokaryotic dsDNA virus sp.]|tara:strand:- start:17438 stop:17683 length:246 start_codon:yes stop_codon:yes gene_type:complete
MSGKEEKELATFSAGIVVTVTPESIEVTTNKLSDDPSTDDERTCAVIAGVLIRKAAANIDSLARGLSKEDILEALKDLSKE